MQQGVRRCQFLNHHWAQLKFVLLRSKCTLAGGQTLVKNKYAQTNLLVKQEIPQCYRQELFWTPLLCFSTQVTLLSKTFSRRSRVLSVRQKITSYGTVSCQFFTPQKDPELLGRVIQLFPGILIFLSSLPYHSMFSLHCPKEPQKL